MKDKNNVPRKPTMDWRFPLSVGLAVGVSLPAQQAVLEAWTDSLGYWLSFSISLLMAAAVGGLVAAIVATVLGVTRRTG